MRTRFNRQGLQGCPEADRLLPVHLEIAAEVFHHIQEVRRWRRRGQQPRGNAVAAPGVRSQKQSCVLRAVPVKPDCAQLDFRVSAVLADKGTAPARLAADDAEHDFAGGLGQDGRARRVLNRYGGEWNFQPAPKSTIGSSDQLPLHFRYLLRLAEAWAAANLRGEQEPVRRAAADEQSNRDDDEVEEF